VYAPGQWVDSSRAGWVEVPADGSEWAEFVRHHGGSHSEPLAQVVRVARANGCRSVVVESRYVDADYRSEYTRFWAQRFVGTPPFARRLHFFSELISEAALHEISRAMGYLGYAVLRPFRFGSLGRVVMAPPAQLGYAVKAKIEDAVSLFGTRLSVEGAPFYQDGEFLRCAHVAAWVCHFTSSRRTETPRQLIGTFAGLAPRGFTNDRALPSKGLTINQLQAVFEYLGQPALFYGLSQLPRVPGVLDPEPGLDASGEILPPGLWDSRMFSIICRYLNSGFPVLVATNEHAFVLVGWLRDTLGRILFIACDDQKGPYEMTNSPFTDERGPWQALMIPLPAKVYLSGEMAETVAHETFKGYGSRQDAPSSWSALAKGLEGKTSVSLRAVLLDSRVYKERVSQQGRQAEVVRLLRLARLPQWIWVVEAHDRAMRDEGKPSVVAEVIFDTTSSDLDPRQDVLILPGAALATPPDGADPDHATFAETPWESLLSGH
jgi:hypothetical protein